MGRLWLATAFTALALAAGIGYLWHLTLLYPPGHSGGGVRILTRERLTRLERQYAERAARRHLSPPVFIPTGLLLESLRFADAQDLIVTGYLWQRFAGAVPPGKGREPTLTPAEDLKLTEIRRQRAGPAEDAETLLWHFQARVRQHHLATASYPLDQETLALTVQQADPALAALPIPDLAAYRLLSPAALPGLAKGLEVPGWSLLRSWFALSNADQAAEGDLARDLQAGLLQDQTPPLQFRIETRRSFVDAFFSNLMPLIVVAVMLFVILVTTTGEAPVMQRMKTGTSLALSMGSALFFVVVFAHIGVRQRISGDQIFYLEYFYFLMYVLLLGVSLSAILFVMNPKSRFFQYRHNLISKLLYWPVALGLLFVTTLVQFY